MQSVVVDVTKFYKKLGAGGEKKWTLQKSPFKATFFAFESPWEQKRDLILKREI